jgi:hypothetical protein
LEEETLVVENFGGWKSFGGILVVSNLVICFHQNCPIEGIGNPYIGNPYIGNPYTFNWEIMEEEILGGENIWRRRFLEKGILVEKILVAEDVWWISCGDRFGGSSLVVKFWRRKPWWWRILVVGNHLVGFWWSAIW